MSPATRADSVASRSEGSEAVSVRRDLQAHLAGRITTTGQPLRRFAFTLASDRRPSR